MTTKMGLEVRWLTTILSPCTFLELISLKRVIMMKELKTMVKSWLGRAMAVWSVQCSTVHRPSASPRAARQGPGRRCPRKVRASRASSW